MSLRRIEGEHHSSNDANHRNSNKGSHANKLKRRTADSALIYVNRA
jgi:hypothetical protein